MKFGIVVFPGSNCDLDAQHVLQDVLLQDVKMLWHKNSELEEVDVVILPGGFSYGDYLRAGAIARFSPIMDSVIEFANKGKPVLGICNGFQILLEARLLPGLLFKNNSLQFVCKDVYLKTENMNTVFTNCIDENEVLKIPIAHGEGNYFVDEKIIEKLESNNQILFRYSSKDGNADMEYNPNGSILNIAGIANERGNILGMMPHPERCCDPLLGKTDGTKIFNSIINSFNN